MSSGRNCQRLLLCAVKSMPTSAKMDLLLVKAKPVKSDSSTSGITDLRRKLNPAIAARERSENV